MNQRNEEALKMDWRSDEYRAAYWNEKKKEYQRALDFCNEIKPGDTVTLTRYACPQNSPYSLDDTAHITTRETVKIYAMHKDALWFTTYGGHAIEAKTVIKWQKQPTQGFLF